MRERKSGLSLRRHRGQDPIPVLLRESRCTGPDSRPGLWMPQQTRGKAESSQAARFVPEEHLQNEKINMQKSDQGNSDIRDCRHIGSNPLAFMTAMASGDCRYLISALAASG